MKNSIFHPHKLIDRLIMGVLLVFVLVVALLTFALVRHTRWQQVVTNSGMELRDNVEGLQETTNELQEALDRLRAESPNEPTAQSELDVIDEQLTELDTHLDQMEQTIADVSPILGEDETTFVEELPITEEVETIQDELHGLFTTAAWLIGITSIVIAIIAFVVLNPKSKRKKRGNSQHIYTSHTETSDLS